MAHKTYLLSGARQLRELADQDAKAVQEARDLVHVAEEQLEEATVRSEASRKALEAVETRLNELVPTSPSEQDGLFSTSTAFGSAATARASA
ncbi:hypothetical protein RPQ02_40250 [Streptomyces sp. AM2-3-1]|uniref:hypothetical protein n=1 Tax=Streptomyces sp. AM2-3-1 TaxID=3075824 RepID=UPI0028C39A8E|nr:hypothetical protein [Streptomyces sp. AM2-3-1]WNO62400.1 hypothetical protein RPQ02_00530 [Streptomyces sp. AM2-3-1]WNO69546.1 hypothetical protein RPQ02_40250 [Streptomyces sp. AM2-3-1]